MSEAERYQKILEDELARQMLAVETWRDGEDGREAVLKYRWSVIEEDENRGLYEGDEGILVASVVGSPEYNNERVSITFLPEGCDSGDEVRPFDDVEPIT